MKNTSHSVLGQLFQINPGRFEFIHPADRKTIHPFQHQHIAAAKIVEHFRHQELRGFGKIAPQLRGIAGFKHQVEFIVQIVIELGHYGARAQAAAVGEQASDPAGQYRAAAPDRFR